MHEHKAAFHLSVLSLFLPIFAGCTISPLSQRATTFSTAACAAILQVRNGYQVVEQSYYDAQAAHLVTTFDKQGFDPSQIQPFMRPADMKVRNQLLAGLQQYATLLAEVSGNDPIDELDKQSQTLGAQLHALSTDANLTALTKNTSMDAGLVATAVDALGRALIERKRAKELPSVLEKMQKPIDQICQLLEEDIGNPEKSGLRNQLSNDYDELVKFQTTFIFQNESRMTPEEKRKQIQMLPRLVTEAKQADAALEQTQDALHHLATAHDALAETRAGKDAPAFRSLVSQLAAESQQLGSVYAAVTATTTTTTAK